MIEGDVDSWVARALRLMVCHPAAGLSRLCVLAELRCNGYLWCMSFYVSGYRKCNVVVLIMLPWVVRVCAMVRACVCVRVCVCVYGRSRLSRVVADESGTTSVECR